MADTGTEPVAAAPAVPEVTPEAPSAAPVPETVAEAAAPTKKAGVCYIKDPHNRTNQEWASLIHNTGVRALEEHKAELIPLPECAVKQLAELAAENATEAQAPAPEAEVTVDDVGAKRPAGDEAAGGDEPAPKRQRVRGQNKGKERKAHSFNKMRGEKPTWEGEVNFLPHGFPKDMRKRISHIKKRKDWKCDKCNQMNSGKYQAFSCMKCNEMISEEQDLKTLPKMARGFTPHLTEEEKAKAPQQETPPIMLEPAAAGWFNPREKKRLDWSNKAYLSPLTTVGNLPFRRICTKLGADITCSEMACAHNLLLFQASEWSLLRKHESEKMFGLQIAASSPTEGAMLGKMLADSGYEYDFVDINCGCPVDCITNKGMGSALLETRNRHRLKGILSGLHYQPKPVTIKVRIGADERNPTLHTWLPEVREWGAEAITIHGRSKRQRYSRLADWDYISKCAELSPVPVIGNGDLLDYTAWNEHLKTGAQGVMTGRGALIKPWLFTEIKEQRHWDISATERLDLLKEFTNMGLAHWGADVRGRATTRKFMCEWLSFLCRYVPPPLLERVPQRHNERPQAFVGRSDLETLMASDRSEDWVRISEILLGPAEPGFNFVPKHKSSAYTVTPDGQALKANEGAVNEE